MSTIYPRDNGGSYNTYREEELANTYPQNVFPPELTPTQLDELRAKAPVSAADSHDTLAAAFRKDQQARQKERDAK